MKPTKDNFSNQATTYQKFRPVYPPELYNELLSLVSNKKMAWDCGTGNGQVALVLADHFEKVIATDISEKQLNNAPAKNNIQYLTSRAEKTDFPDNYFDLITVAQAIHWFDLNAFFAEVQRVIKPDGLLAVWGYGLLRIDPAVDTIIDHFYTKVIGPYWDAERRLVDEAYTTIPFPLNEIEIENTFSINVEWNRKQLEGYLKTWSSVQKYIGENKMNPVDEVMEKMNAVWKEKEEKHVVFPLFLRFGKCI